MKTKQNFWIKSIELLLVFIVLVVFQTMPNSWITIVFSIICGMYCLFASSEKAMYLLLLLIPLAENLTLTSSLTLPIVLISICFIKSIVKVFVKGRFSINIYGFMLILLFLYSCICTIIIKNNVQLITTIKFIMILNFINEFYKECKNKNLLFSDIFTNVIRYLGLGLIFASIFSYLYENSFNYFGRFSFGGSSTVNVIGIQCAVDLIGIIYIFIIKKNKPIDVFLLIGNIIVIILTMSRTAIMMMFISFILYVVFILFRGGNIRFLALIMILIAVSGLLYNNPTINSYINKIYQRFESKDISNGRYILWEQTIDKMVKNKKYLVIGAGDYNSIGAVYGKNNSIFVAHNFLLETWVIYGTIGSFIILLIFYFFIKESFIERKEHFLRLKNMYSFVPFISYSAGLFYSHQILGGPNLIIYIICILPIFAIDETVRYNYEIKKSII